MSQLDEEPAWKKLRLSLERPYKDDSGQRIPVLYDLAPDGTRVYEPCVVSGLAHNLLNTQALGRKHPLQD